MTAPTIIRHFSTGSLPPAQGAARWRQFVAAAYNELDITPEDGWSSGALDEIAVGTLQIATVQVDAQRVVRRRGGSGAVPAEDMMIVFPQRGAIEIRQGRRTGTISPGGMCVMNTVDHYEARMGNASQMLTVRMPVHLLRSRLGSIEELYARPDLIDPALAAIARRFAADLMRLPAGSATIRFEGL